MTMFIGTHIGAKIAIKRGESLVTVVMAVTVLIAGMALIYTSVR